MVCRGFSDAIECGASSFDFGDDAVDGFSPNEGLGVGVPV